MNSLRRTPTTVDVAHPPESVLRRAIVFALFLLILAGLTVGGLALGSYFVAESRRLSLGQVILLWFGDAVALFWFAVYFVRHVIVRVPIQPPSGSSLRTVVLTWVALVSVVGSIGLDLWTTVSLRDSEREAFADAERVVGSIDSLTKVDFPKRVAYRLQCRFTDTNQVVQTPVFQLRDPDELPSLPVDVVEAIRAEKLPVEVTIAYQADRPARSWLADLGWRDATRVHGFSLCVLLFQGMFCFLFVLMMLLWRSSTGALPWWYDLHGVLMVSVEAAFLLLFGGLILAIGAPIFWGDF